MWIFLIAAAADGRVMDELVEGERGNERVFISVHVYLIQTYHEVLCRLRMIVHNRRGLTS